MKKSKFQKRCLFLGLVLIFGASIIACAGFSMKNEFTTADKIAIGGFVLSAAGDVGTTVYGLNNGASETNPIWGEEPSPGVIILVNAAITGAIVYLSQWWTSKERQVLWVPTLFRGFAAVHNYSVIKESN